MIDLPYTATDVDALHAELAHTWGPPSRVRRAGVTAEAQRCEGCAAVRSRSCWEGEWSGWTVRQAPKPWWQRALERLGLR